MKYKYIITALLFSCVYNAKTQNRNLLKDYDKLQSAIELFIINEEVDSLLIYSTENFKKNNDLESLKSRIRNINKALKENGFKSFNNYDIGGKANQQRVENGVLYKSKIYNFTPKLVKDLNARLFNPLESKLNIQLVERGNIWYLNSLLFNDIKFGKETNIKKYIENILTKNNDSLYLEQVQIIRNGFNVKYSNAEDLKFSLEIPDFELVEIEIDALPIDFKNFTKVSFFIEDPRNLKTKTYIGGKTPKRRIPKEVIKPIEFLFSDDKNVIITDTERYGVYDMKERTQIIDYIKNSFEKFVKKAYQK